MQPILSIALAEMAADRQGADRQERTASIRRKQQRLKVRVLYGLTDIALGDDGKPGSDATYEIALDIQHVGRLIMQDQDTPGGDDIPRHVCYSLSNFPPD